MMCKVVLTVAVGEKQAIVYNNSNLLLYINPLINGLFSVLLRLSGSM